MDASFDTLGLSPETLKGAMDAGFESPTPIQARSIPILLTGSDLVDLIVNARKKRTLAERIMINLNEGLQ